MARKWRNRLQPSGSRLASESSGSASGHAMSRNVTLLRWGQPSAIKPESRLRFPNRGATDCSQAGAGSRPKAAAARAAPCVVASLGPSLLSTAGRGALIVRLPLRIPSTVIYVGARLAHKACALGTCPDQRRFGSWRTSRSSTASTIKLGVHATIIPSRKTWVSSMACPLFSMFGGQTAERGNSLEATQLINAPLLNAPLHPKFH
jgi:hypothetical protein